MIKIAIVEDNEDDMLTLKRCLERFEVEKGVEFDITVFGNGIDFLSNYKVCYDIIMMDIAMPVMDGMETARKLREMDEVTQLIFITNLSQYALGGYEVGACDYIMKPVNYYSLALRFTKAVNRVKKTDDYITMPKGGGIVKICLDKVSYIEVSGHMLTFHTVSGDITVRGTISSMEEKLSGKNFARCNSHYLVNLSHVTSVKGLTVSCGDASVPMSRGKRAEFLEKMNRYEIDCAKAG